MIRFLSFSFDKIIMIVLGVAAHPDDLDFGAAGSFAKWAREGASCYYLICTDGSKGSNDPKMTEGRLIKIRRGEQLSAGKVLGLKGVFFLNHKDTQLAADLELKKEVVRYIRKLRPDIVVAMDPTLVYSKRGFVNHTDHRAAGQAAIDAVYPMARDRLTFNELEKEGLSPHKVKTLYLINFDNHNEVIDITKTINAKIEALSCHKSQISEESLKRARKMASIIGKEKGYKYAEAFVKLEFDR
ncbi:MAG: PIG-L deacetylase family protein [Candidatus Micrarchaeaceae archaeon]